MLEGSRRLGFSVCRIFGAQGERGLGLGVMFRGKSLGYGPYGSGRAHQALGLRGWGS